MHVPLFLLYLHEYSVKLSECECVTVYLCSRFKYNGVVLESLESKFLI